MQYKLYYITHVIFKEFPAKVKDLDQLAASKKWSLCRLTEIEEEAKKTVTFGAIDVLEPAQKRKRLDTGGNFLKHNTYIQARLQAPPLSNFKIRCTFFKKIDTKVSFYHLQN